MLITHALQRMSESANISGFQIVADPAWRDAICSEMPASCHLLGFSAPGETRQGSVLNALQDLSATDKVETVLIHDAARPLITPALIDACFAALPGYDGVMPVLPMTDTVYYSENGQRIERLLDRSCIYAGQAPELFRFRPYLEANLKLTPARFSAVRGSSEPAFLGGMNIAMIPGDVANIKVTTRQDLLRCEQLLKTPV